MGNDLARMFLVIVSYLLGSIPFGLITAMAMGAGDIRKIGSGNIGATNVLRSTGKLGGLITFILDSLKGVIPVLIAKSWWGIDTWTLSVAFVAVLGHNFPIFLKFKGGKGVATSLGVITALWPYGGIITMAIWLVTVVIWRYSSLGALISFAILPIIIILGEMPLSYFIFSILISLMLFYRHIENIKRLLTGQEKKIGKGVSSALILLFLVLSGGSRVACAEGSIVTPTIPSEIQRLWDARRTALHNGDNAAGDALLNNIIETRYKLGLNRVDDISALLIREGYQAIEKGKMEDAGMLSSKAKEISPGYAPSYYLSALSLFKMSKIMPAVSEYIEGVKASLQDFQTIFTIAGKVYTVVMVAIGLTALTFLIAWLSRLLPIFHHTFRETTSGFINSNLMPVFFITILIIPLLFGIGWFVIFWIVAAWIYLVRKERVIAVMIVVFFLFLPQTLRFSSVYLTAEDNVALKGLLSMERGYGEPGLIKRLDDQYKREPGNSYLPLSLAYLLDRQGDAEEALQYYKRLLNTDQKYIRIWALNNTGNIYFRSGNYDHAIVYYQKAMDESPQSAIPSYNLSQAYREKLMFAESEGAYETAKGVNPEEVERYTNLSVRGRGYKVIDFPVSRRDLWSVALSPTEDSKTLAMDILQGIFKIPHDRILFLGISILIVLTVLTYVKLKTPMAYYCPECGRAVCGLCTGSRIFGNKCKECRRGEKIEKAREIDRRISFILPGLWHMYNGRLGVGGMICFTFFLGLAGLISGGIGDPWYMAYYIPERFYVSWLILIMLPYLVLTLQFKYIKIRFNT